MSAADTLQTARDDEYRRLIKAGISPVSAALVVDLTYLGLCEAERRNGPWPPGEAGRRFRTVPAALWKSFEVGEWALITKEQSYNPRKVKDARLFFSSLAAFIKMAGSDPLPPDDAYQYQPDEDETTPVPAVNPVMPEFFPPDPDLLRSVVDRLKACSRKKRQ